MMAAMLTSSSAAGLWDWLAVVMGRCRFFKSVSVFGFLFGFLKVGSVFGVGFREYRDISIGFSFFFACFLNSYSL
jgi:hypothetical protein